MCNITLSNLFGDFYNQHAVLFEVKIALGKASGIAKNFFKQKFRNSYMPGYVTTLEVL